MTRTVWISHPVVVFILSVLALGTSLFLYIYWYIGVSAGLKAMVKRFELDPSQVLEPQTWVVILVLSILVGVILLGIFTIYAYNRKILQLYRLQHNFINNFTHELKTPVTSLKLFLETMEKHQLERKEQTRYIGYMIQDVNRLSEHINRILDLARLESRNYETVFEATDAAEAVQRFLEENAGMFRNSTVRIHPQKNGRYPVLLDRTLFDMLLVNLVANAMHHNRSSTPEVDIRVCRSGRSVEIRLTDNGVGLEKKDLRRVFRKFYQAERAEDRSTGGTGIGLHLVQSIAKLHGGKVSADSPGPGKGSTFTLSLPLAD
ncbi:MAG: HAMP domain-containing histidine kinase [Desulfobacteraceae bacterium]|nr:HAMP domain-containing histidine kinase [Desulfobacteraceae bacterium]